MVIELTHDIIGSAQLKETFCSFNTLQMRTIFTLIQYNSIVTVIGNVDGIYVLELEGYPCSQIVWNLSLLHGVTNF
jgi:hypothetical protein